MIKEDKKIVLAKSDLSNTIFTSGLVLEEYTQTNVPTLDASGKRVKEENGDGKMRDVKIPYKTCVEYHFEGANLEEVLRRFMREHMPQLSWKASCQRGESVPPTKSMVKVAVLGVRTTELTRDGAISKLKGIINMGATADQRLKLREEILKELDKSLED